MMIYETYNRGLPMSFNDFEYMKGKMLLPKVPITLLTLVKW